MAVTWEFWNFIVFLKIAFFSACGVWIFIIIIIILHLNVEYRYFFTGHWKTFGLGVFIFWLFFPLLAVPSSFFPSAYFSTAWACSASLTNHILFFLKSYTRTVSSPWNSVLLILWLTVIHLSAHRCFAPSALHINLYDEMAQFIGSLFCRTVPGDFIERVLHLRVTWVSIDTRLRYFREVPRFRYRILSGVRAPWTCLLLHRSVFPFKNSISCLSQHLNGMSWYLAGQVPSYSSSINSKQFQSKSQYLIPKSNGFSL